MKVYRGTMITCDASNTVARYLVEDQGRICYVGDDLPSTYDGTETVDLKEQVLIPAFTDSHIHFASYATFHAGLNVMDAKSNEEIMAMLKKFTAQCKDKMILGFGASPHSVVDGVLISRTQLDAVCKEKPLFLVKYDGHACVINSALLSLVKDKIAGLRGYHEDTGEMNQDAFFAVSDYVTSSIPLLKLVTNMQRAVDDMAAKGIAMIHTVSGVGFTRDLDVDLERWFAAGLPNGIQMRVFFQTMDVDKVVKRRLPRIGGCFATALDGCFGSADAALLRPYENSTDCGVLYYSDEEVTAFCKKANRAGLQIEMHAIGDAAFAQATKALKAALDDFPRQDHRHVIIHACLPTAEGIDICARYGILLAVQTAFIRWPQEPDAYLERILGERSSRLNPLRSFAKRGIVMSAGSDGPCTEPDPIQWLYKACNHSDEAQALTVAEALRLCTYQAAYTSFDEKERGSLEQGKIADMVILSENPYEMPKENLKELQVKQLLIQGRPYQPLPKSPVTQILRGLVKRGKGC